MGGKHTQVLSEGVARVRGALRTGMEPTIELKRVSSYGGP